MSLSPSSLTQAQNHLAVGDPASAEALCAAYLEQEPKSVAGLHLLGRIRRARGDDQHAAALFQQALAIEPAQAAICLDLVETLEALGQSEEGIKPLQLALWLQAEPRAGIHSALARILFRLGRIGESAGHARQAAAINPRDPSAFFLLGAALMAQQDLDGAIAAYRDAVRLAPDNADLHNSLGLALMGWGDPAGAQACFSQAAAHAPDSPLGPHNLGNALREQGRFTEAESAYRAALRRDPVCAAALAGVARCRRFQDPDDADLLEMRRLLADERVDSDARAALHMGLGKALEECGRFAEAFDHFERGNRLHGREIGFDMGAETALIQRIKTVFDGDLFQRARRAAIGSDSERPLFIVGMYRSGTTLAEQILAAHREVFGAGELPLIDALVAQLPRKLGPGAPYPDILANPDPQVIKRLAADYLAGLDARAGSGPRRVTDKMPPNFLHLGLIALLFPRARIIHCRRHPADVCLSIWFQKLDRRIAYAHDLESLGRYHRLYEALMAHWKQALPLPILDLPYEALATDPEPWIRRLVDFCGLPWDPACLAPHRTQRAVQTASAWQARQPINPGSVARWRRHAERLGPLWRGLGGEPES